MWQLSDVRAQKNPLKTCTELIEYNVLLWRLESFFTSLLLPFYKAEPEPFCGTCCI